MTIFRREPLPPKKRASNEPWGVKRWRFLITCCQRLCYKHSAAEPWQVGGVCVLHSRRALPYGHLLPRDAVQRT